MADLDGKSEEYPDIHRLALSSVDKFGLFHPCGPPAGHFLDGKLHTGVSLRFVTVQNQVTEVFGERTTPGFTLLDLNVSYPLGKMLLLKGGIQNLLDETFFEHLSCPIGLDKSPMYAPGRNFFVMVSFKFP